MLNCPKTNNQPIQRPGRWCEPQRLSLYNESKWFTQKNSNQMKKTRHYLILTSAALLMMACSNETMLTEESAPSMENAITFTAEMDNGTRASGETSSLTGAIGVFASYTGDVRYNLSTVSPNYMYNQQVTQSGSEWTYTPVKYWPGTSETDGYKDYVSFFAYYPYITTADAAAATDGIIGFSNEDDSGDPWLVYQLPANAPTTQTDLLYGVKTDGSPMLDVQKQNVSGKVAFNFRHALACVGDQMTIRCSDALKALLAARSLYINSVTIHYKNLTNKARLILNSNSSPNWQPVISGEYTSSRTVSLSDATYIGDGTSHTPIYDGSTGQDVTISDKGLFYIPMHLGAVRQEAEITVTYTIKEGETTTPGSVTNSYFLKENAQQKESINIILGEGLLPVP